jgi:aminoglycoside phosphotransferase (APT) family kinase protein
VNLPDCLPESLRGPTTTITRITTGLSGAGVYKVDAGGETYVLKISAEQEPLELWRRKVEIQERAGAAGVAPRVVHTDAERRAIVSAFVADRSFIALVLDPRTRADAVVRLGETLRRLHDLPIPDGAQPRDPRAQLAQMPGALTGFARPAFVDEAIARVLAEPPAHDRAPVLSHNDVNPTNLAFDGERVVLLDWDLAASNHPLYDLATASLFLGFDDATCARLLAAHDGAPEAPLPEAFGAQRRLVGVLCGTLFLHLARMSGHAGAATVDAPPSLADVHAQMRTRALTVATADGKWAMGLALVREGIAG